MEGDFLMKTNVKSIVAGILLSLLVIRLFYSFAFPVSYQLFTLFLAYTAGVYPGAALSDLRFKWISIETLVSLVIFSFLGVGIFPNLGGIGLFASRNLGYAAPSEISENKRCQMVSPIVRGV
jgi:hypothetical protein